MGRKNVRKFLMTTIEIIHMIVKIPFFSLCMQMKMLITIKTFLVLLKNADGIRNKKTWLQTIYRKTHRKTKPQHNTKE